ncbi:MULTISPECIES: type IV pilus modification PilV family protein [unclassified Yoonia]|uniref:type IV pilus modification PilV family protein n=1 Tax=unclassified Yoonia TaxID=2629118 RepID=UPI002AFDF22F|nr:MULTISPECIES: prepilin-type N-terminal cleavage/methylation domain-containing protein [unclassified Yoonia]
MKGRAGYSLLEVLIAFVILTVILAALIPGQSQLLIRATMQEQQSLAHDYALSRIALLGTAEPLALGIVEDRYRDWSVIIDVQASDMISTVTEIFQITVTIRDMQNRQMAKVKTLRAIP